MTEPAPILEAPGGSPTIVAKPLQLTEKAVEMLKTTLLRQHIVGYGVRVSVVGGGCSGLQYHLELQEKPVAGDAVLEQDGVQIFIDEESSRHLDGAKIDYVCGLHGAGFKFQNPSAARTCGCGSSSSSRTAE